MAEGGHEFFVILVKITDRESVKVRPRFVIAEDFKDVLIGFGIEFWKTI